MGRVVAGIQQFFGFHHPLDGKILLDSNTGAAVEHPAKLGFTDVELLANIRQRYLLVNILIQIADDLMLNGIRCGSFLMGGFRLDGA